MRNNIKLIFTLVLFGLIFISSNLLFLIVPRSIQRQYNLTTTTVDGVQLRYDLYAPAENEISEKKPGIILAHGLKVNKEMMRFLAIELANDGFVVIAHDFRSHGASGGNFNMMAQGIVDNLLHDHPSSNTTGTFPASYNRSFLKADIEAIKAVLIEHPQVDPQNLGYLGFSMGAEAGFEILPYDSDFQATIGMGPTFNYDLVSSNIPRNLLLLVGRYDEAIRIEKLYTVMSYRTSLDSNQIQINTIYGDFSDGTASKLYIDPFAEHFLAPYNHNFVREARVWFGRALMKQDIPKKASPFPSMVILVLGQIIGAIGIFIVCSGIVLKKYGQTRLVLETTIPFIKKGLIPSTITSLIFMSYPLMLAFIPVFAGPLLFTGLILFLIGGPSLAIWVFLKKYYQRHSDSKIQYISILKQSTSPRNIRLGFLNGGILVFLIRFSLGNIFGIVPHLGKWLWLGFYGLIIIGILIPIYWLFELILSKKYSTDTKPVNFILKMGFQTFSGLSFIMITIILVPCIIFDNYFVAMILIPIELLITLIAFIGTLFYAQNKDIFLAIIPIAIFSAIFLGVLSPIFELWHLTY